MLTIDFAEMAIDFENGNVFFAIYFVSGRLRIPAAFADVALEDAPTLHVLKTELAYEEFRESRVFLRVRRRVPSLNLKHAEFDGRWIPTGGRILLVENRLQRLYHMLRTLPSLSGFGKDRMKERSRTEKR